MKKHRSSEHRKSKYQSSNGRKQHNKNKTKHKDDKQGHKVQTCKYCGSSHERNRDKCPAYGKKCSQCGKINHFQSVCRQKKLNQIQEASSDTDSDESIFGMQLIGAVNSGNRMLTVPLTFDADDGETVVKCQIDTGATCNVMSFASLCKLHKTDDPKIKKSTAKLKLYDDSIIDVMGECHGRMYM